MFLERAIKQAKLANQAHFALDSLMKRLEALKESFPGRFILNFNHIQLLKSFAFKNNRLDLPSIENFSANLKLLRESLEQRAEAVYEIHHCYGVGSLDESGCYQHLDDGLKISLSHWAPQ